LLPLNQIWLDPITGLGQWLFLPILASVQQGFRTMQTTKPWIFEVARRLTLGNSQSDSKVSDCVLLIVVTSSTFLQSKDTLKEKKQFVI